MSTSATEASASPFACNQSHGVCIADALSRAEQICRSEGERFTELRRQVLQLVWSDHKPVKAYDLLSALAAKRSGVAPATVYRTLDFLRDRGLVHKLESLNAYTGCAGPHNEHQGYFLICERCQQIKELDSHPINQVLEKFARQQRFLIKKETVELAGICADCLGEG